MVGHHATERIHHDLGGTCSRWGVNHQRISGANISHDRVLFPIGVREVAIHIRGASIGVGDFYRNPRILQCGHRVRISPQGIHDVVLQILSIGEHRFADFTKARNDQPGRNAHIPAMSGEVPQAIERGIGFKRTLIIGQCHKSRSIQTHLQLLGKSPLNTWVEANSGAPESEFKVFTPSSQAHRAHQQGTGVIHSVVFPLHQTNTQSQGVQATVVHQLGGVIDQPRSSLVGGFTGNVIPNEVSQQGGRTSEEPGQATGVSPGNINTVFAAVLEVNQRAFPAQALQLLPPAIPGFGRLVHRRRLRVADAHLVRQITRPPRRGVK